MFFRPGEWFELPEFREFLLIPDPRCRESTLERSLLCGEYWLRRCALTVSMNFGRRP